MAVRIAYLVVLGSFCLIGSRASAGTAISLGECFLESGDEVEAIPFLEGVWVRVGSEWQSEMLCPDESMCAPGGRGEEIFGDNHLVIAQVERLLIVMLWRCPIEFGLLGICQDMEVSLYCAGKGSFYPISVDGDEGARLEAYSVVDVFGLFTGTRGFEGRRLTLGRFEYQRVAPSKTKLRIGEQNWREKIRAWNSSKKLLPPGVLTLEKCLEMPEGSDRKLGGYWIIPETCGKHGLHRLISFGRIVLDITYLEGANLGRDRWVNLLCNLNDFVRGISAFGGTETSEIACPIVGEKVTSYIAQDDNTLILRGYSTLRAFSDCASFVVENEDEWRIHSEFPPRQYIRVGGVEDVWAEDRRCEATVVEFCDRNEFTTEWLNKHVGWVK